MELNDIESDLTEILFTEEQIRARIAELAREIEADYPDGDVLLVGVLKGAVIVMAEGARTAAAKATATRGPATKVARTRMPRRRLRRTRHHPLRDSS